MELKKLFKVSILLFVFSLINCQKHKKMEEKFNWSGGICAPKEYQMQVYHGQIIADDYQYQYSDIVGTVQGGWGEDGEAMGTSDGLHDIPHTLEFTWYSVVEDKFYAGHWELDTSKITKLFKEGFLVARYKGDKGEIKYYKKETYNSIVIGLAPKGRLVVWISGEMGQVEVGYFQGKEIKITKEEAYEDFRYVFKPNYRTEMLKAIGDGGLTDPLVYKKIQKEGYPDPKIYNDYRERFNWRLKFIISEGNIIGNRGFMMCNGEKEIVLDNNHNLTISYQKRAIPYYFGFSWTTKEGENFNSEVAFTGNPEYIRQANKMYNGPFLPWDFNKTEIYKLFKEKLDKEIPIDIVVDVSNNKDAKVYIEQGGKQYPITQMEGYVKQGK